MVDQTLPKGTLKKVEMYLRSKMQTRTIGKWLEKLRNTPNDSYFELWKHLNSMDCYLRSRPDNEKARSDLKIIFLLRRDANNFMMNTDI